MADGFSGFNIQGKKNYPGYNSNFFSLYGAVDYCYNTPSLPTADSTVVYITITRD